MLFSDVIGQQEVKQHLTDLVANNRLSHALLFLGKEGSGALPLAVAFAQYLVSLPQQAAAEPVADLFGGFTPLPTDNDVSAFIHPNDIAAQPAYARAAALQHPDLHFSFPVISKKSGEQPVSNDFIADFRSFFQQFPYGNAYDWLQSINAENKQGNITGRECDEISRKLSLKAYESRYKVLVLWMPEYLGNMGNKLLKLIEEPPPNTIFLLVAENEEQILLTIRSRCQLIKVPTLHPQEVADALVQRNQTAPELALQVANICDGNYREALQQIAHAGDDWLALVRDCLNASLRQGPAAEVKWVDEMNKLGREKQKQFLQFFNHLLAQSLRLRILGDAAVPMADAERELAHRMHRMIGFYQLQAIVEELDKAAYYVERNANSKMLFHALSIKMRHIVHEKQFITAV